MNRPYTIATLGSHSALQILKGAHDEGFRTLAISNRDTERLYRSFAFVDEVIALENYSEFMSRVDELANRKAIIVPHGSFVAYLSLEEQKKMTIPYFGNKAVLDWKPAANCSGSGCRGRGSRCRASSRAAPKSTARSS